MPQPEEQHPPMTVPAFRAAKSRGQPLAVLTCYDYTFARLLDTAGLDALLVGDSLGMVLQGRPNSLRVTMRQMAYHTECVARGTRKALVITDMPFLSYQASPTSAVRNAGRLLQAGAAAVKIEGGTRMAAAIRACTRADIPVMGHVGLTPQSVQAFGGFRVQRDETRILDDARSVQDAGAFALVLESVPAEIARKVTDALEIPTIGIGAGPGCDGQVLVLHDMLGLYPDFTPKFVRKFAELADDVRTAASGFAAAVRSGQFPAAEHSFK